MGKESVFLFSSFFICSDSTAWKRNVDTCSLWNYRLFSTDMFHATCPLFTMVPSIAMNILTNHFFQEFHLQSLLQLYYIDQLCPPHPYLLCNFLTKSESIVTLLLISFIPDTPIVEMKLTILFSFHCMYKTLLLVLYFQSICPLSAFFDKFITYLFNSFHRGLSVPYRKIEKTDLSKTPSSGQVCLLSAWNTIYIPIGHILNHFQW